MEKIFELTDKVAIVTGASQGLGKATALGLAKAGAHIVATDIRDVSQVVTEINSNKGNAIGFIVDVSKEHDVQQMVKKTIDHFGTIDILVNNAGILSTADAEMIPKEEWDETLNVNLTGQFLCAQAVGKHMIPKNKGKIINISSVAGLFGYASSAHYSASKAGVISLTKTLAVEWGKYNIQVNAICPGVFATDMTNDYLKDSAFVQMIKNKVPLGRYAEPDELIGTVVYLASSASNYVTGHALVIDGGWTAGL